MILQRIVLECLFLKKIKTFEDSNMIFQFSQKLS